MLARDPRVGEDEAVVGRARPMSSGVPSTSIVRSVPSGDHTRSIARAAGGAGRRNTSVWVPSPRTPWRPRRAPAAEAPDPPAGSGRRHRVRAPRARAARTRVRPGGDRDAPPAIDMPARGHGDGDSGADGARADGWRPGRGLRRPSPAAPRRPRPGPARSDGSATMHDARPRRQVVGMGARERERRVGEVAGQGDGLSGRRPPRLARSAGCRRTRYRPGTDRPPPLPRVRAPSSAPPGARAAPAWTWARNRRAWSARRRVRGSVRRRRARPWRAPPYQRIPIDPPFPGRTAMRAGYHGAGSPLGAWLYSGPARPD